MYGMSNYTSRPNIAEPAGEALSTLLYVERMVHAASMYDYVLLVTVSAIYLDGSEHLHQYLMNCLKYSIHFVGSLLWLAYALDHMNYSQVLNIPLNCSFHCHLMTTGISTQPRAVHQT